MSFVRTGALVALLSVPLAPTAVEAATPRSGVLSTAQPSVTWSGGPFVVPSVTVCLLHAVATDPTCDYFYLNVDLGNGAEVRVQLKPSMAAEGSGFPLINGDDYDIYVWSPEGDVVAKAEEAGLGNETVTFIHSARFRNRPYEIEVIPYLVRPGSRYTGTATALTVGA
jgi:hypothetical protein